MSGVPNLKHLILEDCESMPEVDASIFHLQKLEELNVSGCTSLTSLSSNTCSPALRCLNALDCINLKEFAVTFSTVEGLYLGLSEWDGNEVPTSILLTKNLKSFDFPISDCLVDLPVNFSETIWLYSPLNHDQDPFITLDKIFCSSPGFLNLKNLCFYNIPTLFEIPDSIFLLSSLEILGLVGLSIRSLPETIECLTRLNNVEIVNCKLLQSVPGFTRNLVAIDCESLEKVLTSTDVQYDKPSLCFTFILNCKKLDPHSYQAVFKFAMHWVEYVAILNSEVRWNLLPVMPGMENWFHYSSTQVSFTLELPSNLLGFAYYLVLSQGRMGYGVVFGCECYLDNGSGERICITSFTRDAFKFSRIGLPNHLMSDHLLFWYDPISCKQIMDAVEQTKANSDVNNTSNNPKLTFRFFIDENQYDQVAVKECGFRWIYQDETDSSTISESHDEEETASSSDFQSNDQEEIVPSNILNWMIKKKQSLQQRIIAQKPRAVGLGLAFSKHLLNYAVKPRNR